MTLFSLLTACCLYGKCRAIWFILWGVLSLLVTFAGISLLVFNHLYSEQVSPIGLRLELIPLESLLVLIYLTLDCLLLRLACLKLKDSGEEDEEQEGDGDSSDDDNYTVIAESRTLI